MTADHYPPYPLAPGATEPIRIQVDNVLAGKSADGLIREWQNAAPPADVLPLLPAFLAAIVRETGPLRTDHAIITFAGRFIDRHLDPSKEIRTALEASRDRI